MTSSHFVKKLPRSQWNWQEEDGFGTLYVNNVVAMMTSSLLWQFNIRNSMVSPLRLGQTLIGWEFLPLWLYKGHLFIGSSGICEINTTKADILDMKIIKYCYVLFPFMAKKVIDIIIDGNTGKITIHVDGYELEECTELARKLAGSNVLIPTKDDLTIPGRSGKSNEKEKQQLDEKEVVRQ
jgi:hypothetical protein